MIKILFTIATSEVSALDHEVPDNAVELGSLVALTDGLLLGQLDEVLGGDGNSLAEDADLNGSGRNAANFYVEEDLKWKMDL